MPNRSARPCRVPGCVGLCRDATGYCADHVHLVKRQAQAFDRERGSAAVRGYGARWRLLRRMFLAAYPLCVDPFGRHPGATVPATEVDHKTAKRNGGTDAWDNLQALCKPCHSYKTSLEVR